MASSLARLRPRIHRPLQLVGITSLWIGTACNLALWRQLWQLSVLDGLRGVVFGAGLALTISAVLAAGLSLLAWRWTLKPALILLLLVSAGGLHFMLTYGVVIDPTMMTNVLQTDPREVGDLLNLRLVLTLALLGVLPAAVVWHAPLAHAPWPRQLARNAVAFLAGCTVVASMVLLFFQPLASAARNHHQLRYLVNPLNSLYALGQLAARPLGRGPMPLLAIGEDATAGPMPAGPARPPLMLLVLGETGRSGNFGLNGYGRATTPELDREEVVSLRNVWACGTSTAAAVPCMFSHLGRQGFERRRANYENLLDVIQHAGMAVLWIDNQAGCKEVCARVPAARADDPQTAAGPAGAAACAGGECLDEVMLRHLDERIAALPAERRRRGVVVVLHQMGSHGPAYHKRSPPAYKRFLPECASSALQDCSRDEVVNAYDNSIAYTDHFLAAAIGWLRQRQESDTAMVYVADHGESLGENNLYLHGLPYSIAPDVQKRVPWITWLSAGFERRTGVDMQCLHSLRDAPLSHDHYFHSVLGLLGVRTRVYQRSLDVYGGCTGARLAQAQAAH